MDELQRMWDVVMALCKVPHQNFPGGTEENHEVSNYCLSTSRTCTELLYGV
jgi:hypothetical protein